MVLLSNEAYENLIGRLELYALLQEGLDDLAAGKTYTLDEVFTRIGRSRV
jgi:PHD/YefM family antitoxin component YafN of YafNO toxin-antitoxin module